MEKTYNSNNFTSNTLLHKIINANSFLLKGAKLATKIKLKLQGVYNNKLNKSRAKNIQYAILVRTGAIQTMMLKALELRYTINVTDANTIQLAFLKFLYFSFKINYIL